MAEKRKPLNDEIVASKVRLIGKQGENLGEMSLSEAKQMAESQGLDLMQISDGEGIVVVKLLDFGKFLYQKKKQDQKNKQKSKTPDVKTIRISYKISDHDLEVRKNQAEKFASDGHVLKISLMLRGRENHYEDIAVKRLEKFIGMLGDFYTVEKGIQQMGSNFSVIMKPKK